MRRLISIVLLVIWTNVQALDLYHHAHEEEEIHCEAGESHFCEPHAELEFCGLCTVVHASAEMTPQFSVSVSQIHQFTADATYADVIAQRKSKSHYLRGPPFG